MSNDLVPAGAGPFAETHLDAWQEPAGPVPALARSPIERPIAAVRRYKWLMLAVIVLMTAAAPAMRSLRRIPRCIPAHSLE